MDRITEARIVACPPSDSLLALANVSIDGALLINDIRIIDGDRGPYPTYPSRKITAGCPRPGCRTHNHIRANYCNECGQKLEHVDPPLRRDGAPRWHTDVVHFLDFDLKARVGRAVMDAYAADPGPRSEAGPMRNPGPDHRGPYKAHGGKSYVIHARSVQEDRPFYDYMPAHRVYDELFCFGCAVGLNKRPSEIEIFGDINPRIIEGWRQIQLSYRFRDRLRDTPYTLGTFERAARMLDAADVDDRAWATIVRNRMSRGGHGKAFAWSDRLRGKRHREGAIYGDTAGWRSFVDDLERLVQRIGGWQFRCGSALDAIDMCDSAETLHNFDPPYMIETRTAPRSYEWEVTPSGDVGEDRAWHKAFLDRIGGLKGKVMLHGYRSPLYDGALYNWRRVDFKMPNHAGQGKTKQPRLESLWMNYDI